jgi:aspartate aminotransferase
MTKSELIEILTAKQSQFGHKDIEAAITDKTKWLILNSPSNPSGATYTEDELKSFAEVIRKYPHLHVMSDDIYEHITFDGFVFKTLANVAPDLKDRIFIINGVSKAYSMTGWRIGYGAGSKEIIKAMTMIQSQSTSGPSSISQVAAVEALSGTQDYIKTNAINFQKKRDLTLELVSNIPGLECYKSEGAFYLFPKCSDLFGKKTQNGTIIESSNDLATYLLENANVAIISMVTNRRILLLITLIIFLLNCSTFKSNKNRGVEFWWW